jgi:hypothetical protein
MPWYSGILVSKNKLTKYNVTNIDFPANFIAFVCLQFPHKGYFCFFATPMKSFWLPCLFLLFVAACTSSIEPDGSRLGFDYYPLEIGYATVYEIEENEYQVNGTLNTRFYQLKEVASDTFRTLSGQKAYRLERFVRDNASRPWEIDSVWSVVKTTTQVIKTENNIPFIKLVFPLREGLRWNGNALNNQGERIYEVQDFRRPTRIDILDFERSLRVRQFNDSSLVTQLKSEEMYAQNVGLIYAEKINVRFREGEFLGQGQIEFGTIYKQRIIAYGNEENLPL